MKHGWMGGSLALALFLLAPVAGCGEAETSQPAPAPDVAPGSDAPETERTAGTRTVYVPAYSHLSGGGDRRMQLAITLSVRNVDPSATVTLTQVEYFDTFGHRVRRYLSAARSLRPLQTAEFTVDTFDERGGSGANFLVYWEGPDDAHPLLTEAIMFGHVGTGYMSFTSRGVELERPPEIPAVVDEPTEVEPEHDAPAEDPSSEAVPEPEVR